MRHLKRLIFTLLGLVFVTGPVIGIIYGMTQVDKFEVSIGNIIGMTLISILIAILFSVIGVLIDKIFEGHGITIFTAFFLISLGLMSERNRSLFVTLTLSVHGSTFLNL